MSQPYSHWTAKYPYPHPNPIDLDQDFGNTNNSEDLVNIDFSPKQNYTIGAPTVRKLID